MSVALYFKGRDFALVPVEEPDIEIRTPKCNYLNCKRAPTRGQHKYFFCAQHYRMWRRFLTKCRVRRMRIKRKEATKK